MSIYDDLQSVASDVLKDFNQGVIKYVEIVPGGGPVDNPGARTENTFTLAGAVARGAKYKYVSTGLALASDMQVTSSVDVRFTPAANGFIEIDGTRYKIVQFQAIPSAGTPVAWLFIIRKGG